MSLVVVPSLFTEPFVSARTSLSSNPICLTNPGVTGLSVGLLRVVRYGSFFSLLFLLGMLLLLGPLVLLLLGPFLLQLLGLLVLLLFGPLLLLLLDFSSSLRPLTSGLGLGTGLDLVLEESSMKLLDVLG